MTDSDSGFFVQAPYDTQRHPQELELLSDGLNAMIWRGNRDGRFRIFKCLRPEHRGDPTHERMLRKEFEIGYDLQHPNICNFFAFTTLPDIGNCIEMEWIDGCTLAELAADGPLTDRDLCRQIISEICDALSYMHAKHVVHRDLKPSNILVSHLGKHVSLIDFGLSDSESHSILKGPGGTQFFAAPELVAGLEPDWRSDIYSLGRTIASTMKPFGDVAGKCCRSDRKKRYQSAEAVKEALGRRSRWKTAGTVVAASAAVAAIVLACTLALLPSFGLRPDANHSQAQHGGQQPQLHQAAPDPGSPLSDEIAAEASAESTAEKATQASAVAPAQVSAEASAKSTAGATQLAGNAIPAEAASPQTAEVSKSTPNAVQESTTQQAGGAKAKSAAKAKSPADAQSAAKAKSPADAQSAAKAKSSAKAKSPADAQSAAKAKSSAKTQSADKAAKVIDAAAIDSLFRKATELFD